MYIECSANTLALCSLYASLDVGFTQGRYICRTHKLKLLLNGFWRGWIKMGFNADRGGSREGKKSSLRTNKKQARCD